jgi:hypothetical protein
MSGVMIKTGIYGLVRTLTFLGPLPAWAGWLLVAVGVASAVLGVLLALAQHDLKRLLAYSTVENAGIIALGLGLGLVGVDTGFRALAVLGFAGALFHVVNHALAKGLLFLAAGAVLRATHTRRIDALGGLLARMPRTGSRSSSQPSRSAAAAAQRLRDELLVYLGALGAATAPATGGAVAGLVALAALALVGGVAVACFAKAFGVTFLGTPQQRAAGSAEPGPACGYPCSSSPRRASWSVPARRCSCRSRPRDRRDHRATDRRRAKRAGGGVRNALDGHRVCRRCSPPCCSPPGSAVRCSRRSVDTAPTWDCGYAAASPRLQYTGSSFAQPLVDLFAPMLGTCRRLSPGVGVYPPAASFASETPDPCREQLYRPVFAGFARGVAPLRWLQHGRVQLYVLYIAITLLVLLVWRLGEA